MGRIGQRPRAAGPELAVEAVDRARGGEDASDEDLQLGAAASRGDDLGLGLLGVRVDRVVVEARGGAAGQGALEQVQAGLRVAVGVGLGDVALLDLDVDDVAVGVLEVKAFGECSRELGRQRERELALHALREGVVEPGGESCVRHAVPAAAGQLPLDRQKRQPPGLRSRAQLVDGAAVGVEPPKQPGLARGALRPVEQDSHFELAVVPSRGGRVRAGHATGSVSASTSRCVGRAAS